jgi:hypothetical protein
MWRAVLFAGPLPGMIPNMRTRKKPTVELPFVSMATVLERLGGIAPERVVMKPLPGRATEKDLLHLHAPDGLAV